MLSDCNSRVDTVNALPRYVLHFGAVSVCVQSSGLHREQKQDGGSGNTLAGGDNLMCGMLDALSLLQRLDRIEKAINGLVRTIWQII